MIDRMGLDLIDFCRKMDLMVTNGRTKGDEQGEYTFMGHQGVSVVDYALASREMSKFFLDFHVLERVESDHMPICLTLYKETERKEIVEDKGGEVGVWSLRKILWTEKNAKVCIENMKRETGTFYRLGVEEAVRSGDIDKANDLLLKLIYSVANSMVKTEKKKEVIKNKTWFDRECQDAKN